LDLAVGEVRHESVDLTADDDLFALLDDHLETSLPVVGQQRWSLTL
jgi:hypothetical protein